MDYGPSLPSPSPPLLLQPFPLAVEPNHLPSDTSSSSSLSFSPSLLIIAAILACVCVASVSIHLILRLLFSSRRSSSSSSSVAAASLLVSSRSTSASVTSTADPSSDPVKSALIDSLPIFNLSSSLAALPKSSPDCAVCLRPFGPDEDLRLLPACRHAFHSGCVEPWIRKSPSCPLCRAPVTLPPPPLPSVASHTPCEDPPMSRSFDVEIGSASSRAPGDVLSRRNPSLPTPQSSSSSSRHQTHSIGSSFDHMMNEEEEDVEAVVHRIPRRQDADSAASGPVAAGPSGEGSRGWLMDYVDRLSSSSFRFSGRWSHLYDDGGGRESAEPEGTARRETEEEEEDDGGGGLAALYMWVTGV
ncbi:E3 ubiquitin-protein ligase ATL4-like [Musa acuminata AAA Group]|uniref:E3 ubiquitin-protein ligase ATL4-like n=1 Tax=Musa acuminata AAA Group TaxID=214697 RepID=UPI0031DB996E